jgi:HEAT repeat protein
LKLIRYAILLLVTFVLPVAAMCQDEKTNARAKDILKMRKNDAGKDIVLKSLAKEKSDVVLGLALGVHLDHASGINARKSAQIAAATLRRKDFFPQAMTYYAVHPNMGDIVDVLMTKPSGEPIAATILAIYGKVYAMYEEANEVPPSGQPAAAKAKKNKQAAKQAKSRPLVGPPVNVSKHVKQLLANDNEAIQELALLAAAYLRLKPLTEQITPMLRRGSEQVQAAALLFLARTGQELPGEATRKALRPERRANARFTRLSPALATYDVRLPAIGYALESVGEAQDENYLAEMHTALQNDDIRIQIEAARACERIGHENSVPYLLERLKDCSWPTKVYVLSALGAIPSAKSVEPLIKLLELEKGRFRLDFNYALASIFRDQPASAPSIWENHWAEVKDTFKPDRQATLDYRKRVKLHHINLNGIGSFYNLSIFSDRFAYVLDTSMSMKGARIANLKLHLKDSMRALADHVRFNAVTFGGKIKLLSDKQLISSSAGSYIAQTVDNIELNPPTRSYDAIEVACKMPAIDTIMFLSDGAPVSGHMERWSGIIAAYSYFNRYRPVAMYTIEFDAGRRNAEKMAEFAHRNYGRSGSPDAVPEGAPEAE